MWGLFILVVGLPWIAYPGIAQPYTEPKLFMLTIVGWLLILWKIFKLPSEPTLGWRNPFMFWFAGWAVAASTIKFQWMLLQRLPAQTNFVYNSYVWIDCMSLIMGLLLIWSLATSYLSSDSKLHQLTQWVCYSALAVSIYGIFQFIGFDQFFVPAGDSQRSISLVQAGFGNASYLAIYLAVIFPLFFIFSGKRYLLFAGVTLLAIYLTNVHYALAIALGGLTVSLLSRWWSRMGKWTRLMTCMLLFAIGIKILMVGYNIFLLDERFDMWTSSVNVMKMRFVDHSNVLAYPAWTGYGLGSFRLLSDKFGFWDYAHNSYINLWIELGFIGLFLLTAAIIKSLINGWNKSKASMITSGWYGVFIALLLAGLVHFPERISAIALIGIIALSVIERNTGELNA